MQEHAEQALKNVLAMIRPNVKCEEAIRFSQSAANLIQVLSFYYQTNESKKKAGAPANKA